MKKHIKVITVILALGLTVGAFSACNNNVAPQTQEPEAETPADNAVNRADYNIPDEYTKIKIFDGSYNFGDEEIQAAMNDDESKFYIQYLCFDEDQILVGTVENGICTVTYDQLSFLSGNAQEIYDDALASNEPWQRLK